MGLYLYLSGGIQGVPNHRERFKAGANVLTRQGHTVLVPLDVWACPDGRCRSRGEPILNGHTWSCWLRYDLIGMLRCDGIAMLPSWQLSPGARLEVTTAINVGMPMYDVDIDLFDDEMHRGAP